MDQNIRCGLFFIRHFVHTCTHNSKTKGHIGTLYLTIKKLLYYRRYLSSGLELYVRFDRQVIDPNTQGSLFWIQHLQVLTLVTQKLQDLYEYCTH